MEARRGWRCAWFVGIVCVGCGSAPGPRGDRHVLPNGLVHVALVDFDGPTRVVSAAAAAARHEEIELGFRQTYRDDGHYRWFFHAFDQRDLVFVVGRWTRGARSGGAYTAVDRLRVPRSPAAEDMLGVREILASFRGNGPGVKAGMTPTEVAAVLGPPSRAHELGPVGAFDWVYPRLRVRFLENRVAFVDPEAP